MVKKEGKRPSEIFGFPVGNQSLEAQEVQQNFLCPFAKTTCSKRSQLITYPFGVCSIESHGKFFATCPNRFREKGSIDNVPRVIEDIALHYFGSFDNLIIFPEVGLPNIGTIDYVLVRHKPMTSEVEDFIPIEFQSDSTTGTGQIVQGIIDFFNGVDIRQKNYTFGLNTYDTIKRSMTQFFNKGIVYEKWGVKGYWVIQDYIYKNLTSRYGLSQNTYSSEYACRFALYDLVQSGDIITLESKDIVSVSVDAIYQAMRNNPLLPEKEVFITILNKKLQTRIRLDLI